MRRLVVFARSPAAGPVKTRLAATVGEARAVALHRAFVLDQCEFALSFRAIGIEPELSLDAPWPTPEELPPRMPVALQGPGDLGARMLGALERAAGAGCDAAAILGADAPALPAASVREAFTAIEEGAGAAIVPAADGGYVLVATPAPPEALFREVPWGTSEVLAATRLRAEEAGIRLVALAPSFDVDVESDLGKLREALMSDPLRAPRTAALLGIRG